MAYSTTEAKMNFPYNNADAGLIDNDSGMRLFRGMSSPWGAIKGFKETYDFMMRHAALHGVASMNAFKIVEPDYVTRQNAMTLAWQSGSDVMWAENDPFGLHKNFIETYDIPPFLKKGVYTSAIFADYGDSIMTMPGHIWYATNDFMEKEIHACPLDIIGPDACDLSNAGGQHICRAVAHCGTNHYLAERRGNGDPYCLAHIESVKKYGAHKNPDDYDWEQYGPPAAETRAPEKGQPHKKNCDYFDTGEYVSPLGAVLTAGKMYQDATADCLGYSGHAIEGMRVVLGTDEVKWAQANTILDVMFDTAGKHLFGNATAIKEVRDWMNVPSDINDGRVLGSFMSMILQSRNVAHEFTEFSAERTVIECDKLALEHFGRYPEFDRTYVAYFNGMAKTLVSTEWVVTLGECEDSSKLIFEVKKGFYGFKREKAPKNTEKE